MNKNQIFVLFGFVLIGIILYQIYNTSNSKPIKQAFNQQPHQQSDKTVMFFYAPWCHYCKDFKSTWEEIENKYKNTNVKTMSIDCDDSQNSEMVKKYNVTSFPTIFINDQMYNGNRDYETLSNFIDTSS